MVASHRLDTEAGIEPNRANFGKLSNQIGAWASLTVGSLITIVVLVIALLVLLYSKLTEGAVGLLGFFLFVGLLMGLGGLISVRQLRKPGNVSAGVSQFANADQWNVKQSLPPATVSAGETLVDWMGPMSMWGWGFMSSASITGSKETDHNPFNTLLVTNAQLIGVLLTPDDLTGVELGNVRRGVTDLVNQTSEPTYDKSTQFALVNRSRWDHIVAAATSQGLQPLLADHVSFGLPYTDVESFTVSNSWVNPGLVFRLRDGRKMRCVRTCPRTVVDRVAESLSQYLTRA
jgi:hypothetical protein